MNAARCPCDSGDVVDECCGPLLDGTREAPTALALMRSRYSAFVLRRPDYLLRTWHPDDRPDTLEDDGVRWTGLVIHEVRGGGPFDDRGTVRFTASWSAAGRPGEQREHSSFVREAGRWLYAGPVVIPRRG